jgi:MFS family permease
MRDLLRANAGLLFVGVAIYVMMGAGQSMYGPALPAFARDMGLGEARVAWLISTHWIGSAVGVGFMYLRGADVTPRMTVAVMTLGATMVALGLGVWGTFLGAFVFGTGYGAATAVFNPRVLHAFGARGTSMLSLLNASFGMGAIVAPLVFVWLGSVPTRAFGLLAGMILLIWVVAGRTAGGAGNRVTAPAVSAAFRPMWGLQMFAVFGIGLEACLIGLGPTALIATGVTEDDAARRLSAFFVSFLGARVVLVFVAHLVAPFTLYLGAMIVLSVLACLGALVSPGVGFMLMGASAGVFFPSFYVAASHTMGQDPRVPSIILAGGLAGGIAAPILMGQAMPHMDGSGFFWVIAVASAVVAGLGLVARHRLPALRGAG